MAADKPCPQLQPSLVMTSEPVVGVVFGRPVGGKMTLIYICLPFYALQGY